MAVHFTDADFEEKVLKSDQVTLVDFWAEWCGPCHMLAPTIEELATEHAAKVNVGKLDVDSNPEVQAKYQIMSIPTVLVFKGGEVVEALVGVQPKAAYDAAIAKHS